MGLYELSMYPNGYNIYTEGGSPTDPPKGKKIPTPEQLAAMAKANQDALFASMNPMSSAYEGKKIVEVDKTKTPDKKPPKVEPLTEEELKEHPVEYLREKSKYLKSDYKKNFDPDRLFENYIPGVFNMDPQESSRRVYNLYNNKYAKKIFNLDYPEYVKMWESDPIGLYNRAINTYEKYQDYKQDRRDFYEKGLATYANSLIDAALPFINRPYRNLTGKNIKPFDESPNGLLNQFGRWYSRHKLTKEETPQLSGKGADIVSLGNNVIRMTPESKQSTGLFNEFVELSNPSIYKAGDLKNGKIKSFGDRYIPFDDISLYAGVEDGKFKVDKLENFKDNTDIYPARNIKKEFSAPIKKFNVNLDDVSNNLYPTARLNVFDFNTLHPEVFNDLMHKRISDLNNRIGSNRFEYNDETQDVSFDGEAVSNPDAYYKATEMLGVGARGSIKQWFDDTYTLKADPILLSDKYPKIFKAGEGSADNRNKYTVTDINNNTYPVSNLNAAILDNKMVWGNPSGGVFIGSFKDMNNAQLDSLNAYLEKNPSWLVRPDLGSFDTYRLDNPSLESYLQQYFEHPKADDPNVFTVGTTTPNRIWGSAHAYGGSLDANPEKPPVNVDLDYMWNSNQKLGNNRMMNRENMEQLDNFFIEKGLSLPQRQALLYTILQESGADSLGAHGNGYYGLVGWSGPRYNAIKDKSLMGQAEHLYNTLFNGNGKVDWNHGGNGSGYASWTDAQKAFLNAQDFDTAMRALTYGYVRPSDENKLYRIEYGPKHFAAPVSEEQTPVVLDLNTKEGFDDPELLKKINKDMNEYSNGGTIHIKPENKGKFTAAAKRAGKSVQGYASQILANPENYSPTLRKRAQFAHNAAKWHACGGKLYPDGGPIDPPWASFVPSQPKEPQVVRPQQQANPYLLGLSAGMGHNEAAKYSTAAQTPEFQQGYYDGQAQVAASEAVKAGRAPVVESGIEMVSPGLDLSPVGDVRALVDAGEYYQATGDLKTALGLAALGVVAVPGAGKAAERAGREFLDDVTSKEVQQFVKNREMLSRALESMKNYGKQNVPKPTGTLNYSIPSPEPMLSEVPYRLTITPPKPNPMRSLPEPRTFINPDGTVITPGGAVFTPTVENPINRLSAVEKQKLIKSVGDIDFNPKTEPKVNPTTTTTSSAPSTTQDIGNSKKRLKKVGKWMKDNPWKTSAIFAIPTFLGTMPFWDDIGNKVELSNQRKENPGTVINPGDTVYQNTNTNTASDIDTTTDKYAANRALVENMAALDHDEIEWGRRQLDSILNTKHSPMDSLIWENWIRQAIEDSAARQNNYRR